MRRLILFLLGSLICNISLQAQDKHEISISSEVDKAKIYLNGAELQRTVSLDLLKGNNLLVFSGLSPKLNPKSIRVTANKEISVLRISTKTDYLTKAKELPLIKSLKDSIQAIDFRKQATNDELSAYISERTLLEKNNAIGGSTNGVAISELKQAADFYRKRMLEINKKISSLNYLLKKQNTSLQKSRNQLREVNARSSDIKTNVLVLISSAQSTKINFSLKYIVSQAGWVPAYEIKAVDLNQPIELIYKAKVFNNTGVPWRDIQISLSTADPGLSISKPNLKPWYLNHYTKQH